MRNKFSFYASYLEAIDTLPDDQQLQLYKAIAHYALQGEEPSNLTGFAKACFPLIKPNIDSDSRRYDANVRNGSMGGRPNETKTENNPTITQPDPKLETQKNPSITQNNPTESEIKPNKNPNITQGITETKPKHNPHQKPNKKADNGIRITDTEKENESFPSDNKKNNIFFLSDCTGVRPKEYSSNQRELYLTPAYPYHVGDDFGVAELEIVDTLLEIQEYAQQQGLIKYQAKTYTAEQINQILANKGKQLVGELIYKIAKDTTIKNKALYILGSLLANSMPES